MDVIAPPAIASPAAWQAMLDAHDELFEELVPGAWLGVVPRHRTGPDGHRHSTAIAVTPPVPMIVLMREPDRMIAREGEFRGLGTLTADALFVVGDDGVDAALDRPPDAALRELKRMIRTGAAALFFLRTRRELFESGYEELFEALGLPVLGTCR